MSLHSSLKTGGNLSSHRNVLTRTERIERLKATKGFDPKAKAVLGMQKTGNRRGKVG
jgi:small basic protein (TIGR04137 family)